MHENPNHSVHLPILLLLLPLLFLNLPSTTGEIITATITSDSRPFIRFEDFCFTRTGHLSIALSSITITPPTATAPPNSSLLGFFISPVPLYNYAAISTENLNTCVLNRPNILQGFTFDELSPSPPQPSIKRTYDIISPNEYAIFFINCASQTSVSMDVHLETYNLDSNGEKDYLPDGETQLPAFFFLCSLLYFPFLFYWIRVCHQNKPFMYKIHVLMALLLLAKALNLIFAAEDKHYVKVTGIPHGWDVIFYTFQTIRALLLFIVIVLIGTGWSFLKPFLQEKEKKVLLIGIPLQVFVNIAYIIIGETGPFANNYEFWIMGFIIFDLACCGLILIPVAWSIEGMKEASKTDGKAARILAKLRLFRDFYVAMVGYIYVTRMASIMLRVSVNYKNKWMTNAVEESAAFVFYMMMFYTFRPVERNEYFAIDEEEEEAALVAIHSSEFDL